MSSTPDITDGTAIELANPAMRVSVAPSLGAKISQITCLRTSRRWLWHNPHLAQHTPRPGTSYVEEFDTGGWDEVFPTVSPCVTGGAWSGMTLTDHGELWCRPWTCDAKDSADGVLTTVLDDGHLPFRLERRLKISRDTARLTLEYTLANRSQAPMPYIWAAHPLIALTPGMQIRLPRGVRTTCTGCVGDGGPSVGDTFAWPRFNTGAPTDAGRVPGADAPGWAAKLFTERGSAEWVEIAAPDGQAMRLSFDPAEVPHVGLWLNYRGWSGCGSPPYLNAGIEPTTTAADSLADAPAAPVLAPGETRAWGLTVELLDRRSTAGATS